MEDGHCVVYVVSDSVGETADFVVRAAASQFAHERFEIRRVLHVSDQEQLRPVLQAAQDRCGFIAYTLVMPALREWLQAEADARSVRTVDIMGPMLRAFQDSLHTAPQLEPGLVHKLDDDYYRRVEAIEFAVKCDDGRDPRGLRAADVVLIGVSRTSKTPLSMYLALRGLRVANVPLVPESEPPLELFTVPKNRIVGLTIHAQQLHQIRAERLLGLGLEEGAAYASPSRIEQELRFADHVMARLDCRVIDVSRRAVEEIASLILEHAGRS